MGASRQSLAGAPPASAGGPFAGATALLLDWLAQVTDTPVTLGPPVDDPSESAGLRVWPLELQPEQEFRGVWQREPFRFRVRYLVTVAGTDEAAPVLDPVLVAAVAAREVTLVVDPLVPALWQALRARPRTALILDVPAQVARTTAEAPAVRTPLQVREVTMRSIRGRLVGPGDVPMAGVDVEDLATGKTTRTRNDGTFTIAGIPAADRSKLRLTVKGRRLVAEVDTQPADQATGTSPGTDTDPVVIHCDLEEN
ncbi:hypothetical protein [Actinopolymorpha alba]|uniref:hypothetical protein n=1 Tax=Actinopolymorpha alba TaxID=533267 RepID=UPI0003683251|nr:hypothetical protein [Actinopolymorpha alba]